MTKEQNNRSFFAFNDLGQGTKSVHLDWFAEETSRFIADGFRQAADAVVARAANGFGHPDRYFWPAAFLYRHSLELILKEIVREGSLLLQLKTRPEDLRGHNLASLWTKSRAILVQIWSESDEEYLVHIDKVINDLNLVDSKGDAFRYRTDLAGNEHLKELPRILSIESMSERFAETYDRLDAISFGISEYLQNMYQATYESMHQQEY